MTSVQFLLSTLGSRAEAETIARTLVEEKLAACVSLLPEVTSIYTWKGAVERSTETLLIIKTAADKAEAVMARLKALHPYEVPEIVAFDVAGGYPPYLDWVLAESGG